jgi:uncharacterized protein YqeY
MSTKGRLQEDMKAALRAGDKARLSVIRLALAGIKQIEVDERTTLDDPAVLSLLQKMVKQRRESIQQFRAGNREDLAASEEAEIQVLSDYLPTPLSQEALTKLVDEVVTRTGASSLKDMGKVMAAVKAQAAGGADMSAVSALVRERLAS